MFCSNCGKNLPDGTAFCTECGTKLMSTQNEVTPEPTVEIPVVEPAVEETPVYEEIPMPAEEPVETPVYENAPAATGAEVETTVTEILPEPEAQEEIPEAVTKTEAPTEKPKKDFSHIKQNLGKIILGVAAIIILCIIGIVIDSGAASGSGKYSQMTLNDGFFLKADAEKLVNLNGNVVETDESIYGTYYSGDSSLTVAKDADDVFYVVTKKGLVEIDEEISNVTISTYGDTIAYMKDVEDGIGELYLYNVASKKATLIDDEAYAKIIILSPNGKTVAYMGNCEIEEGWYSDVVTGDLFISKNFKEGEKKYSEALPLAVSDNAKYVYYVKDSEKLYMNEEKISSDFSYAFYFNKDVSEMIFNEDGEANYFSAKKKEAVRLKKDSFSRLAYPEQIVQVAASAGSYTATTYGVDTFNETVMTIDGTMYFMSKNGAELEKISSDVSSYKMSSDGTGMLFLDYDGDLNYINNIKKSTDAEKIAEDLEIDEFYASKDLKKVYYVSDDELFYLAKGKGTRIADVDSCTYSDQYKVIYFTEDDELYYATTSSKSKKKIMGETVESVETMLGVTLFPYEDDDDNYYVYRMTGKNKYDAIVEQEAD